MLVKMEDGLEPGSTFLQDLIRTAREEEDIVDEFRENGCVERIGLVIPLFFFREEIGVVGNEDFQAQTREYFDKLTRFRRKVRCRSPPPTSDDHASD